MSTKRTGEFVSGVEAPKMEIKTDKGQMVADAISFFETSKDLVVSNTQTPDIKETIKHLCVISDVIKKDLSFNAEFGVLENKLSYEIRAMASFVGEIEKQKKISIKNFPLPIATNTINELANPLASNVDVYSGTVKDIKDSENFLWAVSEAISCSNIKWIKEYLDEIFGDRLSTNEKSGRVYYSVMNQGDMDPHDYSFTNIPQTKYEEYTHKLFYGIMVGVETDGMALRKIVQQKAKGGKISMSNASIIVGPGHAGGGRGWIKAGTNYGMNTSNTKTLLEILAALPNIGLKDAFKGHLYQQINAVGTSPSRFLADIERLDKFNGYISQMTGEIPQEQVIELLSQGTSKKKTDATKYQDDLSKTMVEQLSRELVGSIVLKKDEKGRFKLDEENIAGKYKTPAYKILLNKLVEAANMTTNINSIELDSYMNEDDLVLFINTLWHHSGANYNYPAGVNIELKVRQIQQGKRSGTSTRHGLCFRKDDQTWVVALEGRKEKVGNQQFESLHHEVSHVISLHTEENLKQCTGFMLKYAGRNNYAGFTRHYAVYASSIQEEIARLSELGKALLLSNIGTIYDAMMESLKTSKATKPKAVEHINAAGEKVMMEIKLPEGETGVTYTNFMNTLQLNHQSDGTNKSLNYYFQDAKTLYFNPMEMSPHQLAMVADDISKFIFTFDKVFENTPETDYETSGTVFHRETVGYSTGKVAGKLGEYLSTLNLDRWTLIIDSVLEEGLPITLRSGKFENVRNIKQFKGKADVADLLTDFKAYFNPTDRSDMEEKQKIVLLLEEIVKASLVVEEETQLVEIAPVKKVVEPKKEEVKVEIEVSVGKMVNILNLDTDEAVNLIKKNALGSDDLIKKASVATQQLIESIVLKDATAIKAKDVLTKLSNSNLKSNTLFTKVLSEALEQYIASYKAKNPQLVITDLFGEEDTTKLDTKVIAIRELIETILTGKPAVKSETNKTGKNRE